LLGLAAVDAAGEHVEKFFGVDLARGCAVGAADFVGEDFEAGHRVGFGLVAEEEVADLLVSVGAMGAGLDSDEAGEDGAGLVVE